MHPAIRLTALAGLVIWLVAPPAAAQTAVALDSAPETNCEVARGPGGLIRGDRIPTGCVLRSAIAGGVELPGDRDWSTPLGPCERHSVRIFYTPSPKRSVPVNAARICGNLLERAAGGELSATGFGPVDRHFGPLDRRFEPIVRHFGPLDRHFEPLDRPLGPLDRPFGARPGDPDLRSATAETPRGGRPPGTEHRGG